MNPAKPIALKDLLRWMIYTGARMARRREWGEIKITVQAGQIMFVTEQRSYRDSLPQTDTPGAGANLAEQLTV